MSRKAPSQRRLEKAAQEKEMFHEEKFRELLIYIAAKCEKDADFSAIKLNQILFGAVLDNEIYLRWHDEEKPVKLA